MRTFFGMTPAIRELWAHKRATDERFIGLLESSADHRLPEVLAEASHLFNADHFWACRILGRPYERELFQTHAADRLRTLHDADMDLWDDVFSSRQPGDTVRYHSTSGVTYENTVGQITRHVVNHSTHHRARITLHWRQHGLEPPVTDLIAFLRQPADEA